MPRMGASKMESHRLQVVVSPEIKARIERVARAKKPSSKVLSWMLLPTTCPWLTWTWRPSLLNGIV